MASHGNGHKATAQSGLLQKVLVAREREVWEALRTKDKSVDASLLTSDFVGLYDTGFITKDDHVKQLQEDYTLRRYTLEDIRLMRLSSTSALLMYKATCEATGSWASVCSKPMYISSLWVKRRGRWLNTFSQDTPAH